MSQFVGTMMMIWVPVLFVGRGVCRLLLTHLILTVYNLWTAPLRNWWHHYLSVQPACLPADDITTCVYRLYSLPACTLDVTTYCISFIIVSVLLYCNATRSWKTNLDITEEAINTVLLYYTAVLFVLLPGLPRDVDVNCWKLLNCWGWLLWLLGEVIGFW